MALNGFNDTSGYTVDNVENKQAFRLSIDFVLLSKLHLFKLDGPFKGTTSLFSGVIIATVTLR